MLISPHFPIISYFHPNRVENGNDDISEEEHFEISEICRGPYLDQ